MRANRPKRFNMAQAAVSQKIWYSTSANPPEFQGPKRRVRRRAPIPNWPASATVFFSAGIHPNHERSRKGIVPVMPHIGADGKRSLMAITKDVFSSLDGPEASMPATRKEFAVDSFIELPDPADIEAEENAKKVQKAKTAWNGELVSAETGSEEGQSLYRVMLTHDFEQEHICGPRGLFNTNNMCFYNSVLQVLVHCGRLNAFINDMVLHTPLTQHSSPIMSGIAHFFYQYATFGNVKRAMSGDEFYDAICNQPKQFHVERGRQEDAQEFLSDLLDVIENCFKHAEPTPEDIADDLVARKRAAANDNQADDGDDGWMEVGQNNKVVETQHAGHQDLDNPVEELFGGRFRSILVKKGGKPSITTEPFQQIPVDISDPAIKTLQQALEEMFKVEVLNLDGGHATKRLEIERLPPVLILNLKRFTFFRQGDSFDYGKITKPVLINDDLTFNVAGSKVSHYAPFGVIYHHGMDISRGHYTADVKVKGQWYSIDDEQVVPVDSDHVVGRGTNKGSQSAYMVFYARVN